jgi:tRNA splicing endonuclease
MMSYGTWTKRGKGWCSVEIDSPSWTDDVVALRFEARHTNNDRYIITFTPGGGEHMTWIAFDDMAALDRALDVLCEDRPHERQDIVDRAGKLEKPDFWKRDSAYHDLKVRQENAPYFNR